MTQLLIRGGRAVDPASGLDALRDIRVRGDRIVELGERLTAGGDDVVLDAHGAVVAPGFFDMHVHLRYPGFPQKETIESGTLAAVRGGFTGVACMPNTKPPLDRPGAIGELNEEVARRAHCPVYPIGTMTRGREGREPSDFAALAEAGAVAFSDDGDTVADAAVAHAVALRALDVSAPLISHCEEPALKKVAADAGIVENVAVARDVLIAAVTGKAWHIAHLSTATSLAVVRWARTLGARVTCEATPHHLNCTAAAAAVELGAGATVNPSLREEADVAALRAGVRDGTIDVFASDHAPHTAAEKSGAEGPVPPGFSGLEIAVGAYAAALPDLPLARFIELLSTNPARILHLTPASLLPGASADITIFADRSWIVEPQRFASLGKFTPFAGRMLPRKVLATIVRGRLAYDAARSAR
ncbi:MAG: dihydroorotase [Candidatus Eremiobacteraeota bacterium]|nr:dihydroorotase [Candidatus Eremiobacteraeota bacterium]